MCSAFTPDSRYDNSIIVSIGNVFCPNTKCSGKNCVHKKSFQCLDRSDYQSPQCESLYQVRNVPFQEHIRFR